MRSALSANLKDLLGEDGFVALAQAFGGTRLYVPYHIDRGHEIARAIGMDRAARLSSRFAPDTLRVPLAREDRAVHYRRHGLSNAQIARRLGVTETGVDKIFAKMDRPPVKGCAQLPLFD